MVAYLVSATFWLVVATLVGLIEAIKFGYPNFLDYPLLAFGRLRPIHTNLAFWGWASMAGAGLSLYVVSKTSRAALANPALARVALWLWNLTNVLLVISLSLGINNGDQEYREWVWWVELPFAVGLILLLYVLLSTIARRDEDEIYVSNWYLASAFIWTIVLATISYLPWYQHGLGQVATQAYYMHNAVGMWFTPLALGLAYYFLPILLNRPIYSYALGVLGFWTQLVFYTMIGAHHFIFSPLPWWIQTVAIVFSVGMIVPVLTGTGNFLLTMRGQWNQIRRSYALPYVLVGVLCYGLGSMQGTIEAFRSSQAYWHLTNFTVGHSHFTMYGFVSFLLWGFAYGLLPRIRSSPNLIVAGAQFWCALIGAIIYVGSLSIGGTIQGADWVAGKPFLQSVIDIAPYWTWRAVGGGLMFVSHLLFAYNVAVMLRPSKRPEPAALAAAAA